MVYFNTPFQVRAVLACFLAWAEVGQCHLPEVFGREYIRLEGEPAGVKPQADAQKIPKPERTDQLKYEKQLEDMELSGGPYASGLTDPLISLAQHHKARGYLDKSLDSLRRALHLVRVNDGLTSDRQIPIVREMLEIYRSRGDYEALGDLYHYYYRVRKLGQPPLSPDLLEANLEYLAWERDLYAVRSDGLERTHLLRAYRANQTLLKALEPTTEQELSWYIRLCLSQLRTLYMVMGDDELSGEGFATGNSAAADRVNREIAFIQKIAYSTGKKLLVGTIELAQGSPKDELAALYLELGDWYQWNDRTRLAKEQYARVEEILLAAGEEKLLRLWLGQPVELPDDRDLWPAHYDTSEPGPVVVEALYNVSSLGVLRNIQVSVNQEDDSWQAWRIKRMLRDTHFRPRFSGGEAQAVEQVSRRYRLLELR